MSHGEAESGRPSLPIEIDRISKGYGQFKALDGVSLSVRSGEFLTLLGPSGSGKTTLLMIVAGFVRADAGSLQFAGEEMVHVPPHKRNVGMVFQNYALFPHMSVEENVAYPLKVRNLPKAEIAHRVANALELVKLEGLGSRKTTELSGGQRQRVALARCIVFEPRVLLMDEPLSALDKNLREAMQIEIRRLHARLGVTTIYVTHDQREALTISDRIAVMNAGRIAQIGTPREIYERPRTSFVGKFVGESYLLPLALRDGVPYLGERRLLAADQPEFRPGANYKLLVRPERLQFCGSDASGVNLIVAKFIGVVYQGDTALVQLCLDSGIELGVRLSSRDESLRRLPAAGDALTMALSAEDAVVVCDDD